MITEAKMRWLRRIFTGTVSGGTREGANPKCWKFDGILSAPYTADTMKAPLVLLLALSSILFIH